ncbi:MAG: hypothetical protein AB2A00_11115 [Myxococcota bacterium]
MRFSSTAGLFLLSASILATGCTGTGGNGSTSSSGGNGASTSSSTGGNGSTSSSSGASGSSSGNGSTSSSSGASGSGSSGSSGNPTAACDAAQDLAAGTNNGDTSDTGDNFVGCDVTQYVLGENAPDQVWKLTLAETSGIRINLEGFDAALYLRKGDTCTAAVLQEDTCRDSAEPDTESLEIGALEAGTYWLIVDGYDDPDLGATSGAYTLDVEIISGGFCVPDGLDEDDPATPAVEGNNNVVDATILPLYNSFTGEQVYPFAEPAELSICSGDEDWIGFIHYGGDVAVLVSPVAGASGTLAAELHSVNRPETGDPTSAVVAGATYASGTLNGTGLNPGEYVVRISGTGTPNVGTNYNFNITPSCIGDVAEAFNGLNNTLADAFGPITTQTDDQGNPQDVALGVCPTDEDWFLVVHQGGDLTVKVNPAAGATGTLAPELQSVTRDASDVPTGTAVAGTTYTGGNLTATALAPGEYAVKIAGTGTPAAGTGYDFNVLFSCTAVAEDQLEARNNQTDVGAVGPFAATIDTALNGALCPGDVDYFWFRNYSGAGNIVVTVGNAANLTVEAFEATVADDKVTGSTASTATVTTEGQNKVVTFENVPTGNSVLVKVSSPTEVAAAGVNYTLAATFPPPANDTCATAQALTLPAPGAAALVVYGTTGGAANDTTATGEGCAGNSSGAKPEVFYSFTPTANVKLTAVTEGFDSILYIREAVCDTGTELTCNDDTNVSAGEYGSTLSDVSLTANTAYFLVVDSYSAGGGFTLTLTTANP